MGIYLNPGNTRFKFIVNSEIYVDKTAMIAYINAVTRTNQRYVSVSRPRRFGKTMAADMLCAYYDRTADSRSLFEKRKIAKCAPIRIGERVLPWDVYLGQFDVIRIVMTEFLDGSSSVKDMIDYLTEEVSGELLNAYPDVQFGTRMNLRTVMNKIHEKHDVQFVVVLDEWDVIFREYKEDQEGQKQYLDFLRDWLKDKDYIALAYMTGILPIKKYGKHSALNMFDEYSMTAPMQLAPFTGFTEPEVEDLCRRYGRNYAEFQEWYDGYEVDDVIPPDPNHLRQRQTGGPLEPKRYALYSPLSVIKAVRTGLIQNYWNQTETYEALAEYIRKDFDGLRESVAILMKGGRLSTDISNYQNDMTTFHSKDDVFALLIHLGYLGYDMRKGQIFIPNREVLDEFKASTKTGEWDAAFAALENSDKLLQATWALDADTVAAFVEAAHNKAGNKTYHDEAALSYAIQLAYYSAEKYYTKILEMDTGKGFADIIYLPTPRYGDKPALLIELKYEKDAETAIDQIHRQNYPDRLEHYRGNLILVAINYNRTASSRNPAFKHHRCIIERG